MHNDINDTRVSLIARAAGRANEGFRFISVSSALFKRHRDARFVHVGTIETTIERREMQLPTKCDDISRTVEYNRFPLQLRVISSFVQGSMKYLIEP